MKRISVGVREFGIGTVLLIATGCATTFRDYPVQQAASYKYHLEQDGVIVAVQPLTRASEQRKYFDTNLSRRNILAVFVVVENHNPQTGVLVSKEDIGLLGGSHQATEEMLSSGSAGRAVVLTGLALLSVPTMFIGATVAAHAENVKYNFRAKELTRQMLSTDEATSGFVYFPLSGKDKDVHSDFFINVELQMLPSNEPKSFLISLK